MGEYKEMEDSAVSVNNSQGEDLRANTSEIQNNASGSGDISLSLAVPLATGFLYILFSSYMAAYCITLSLPFGSLDLPSSFYLHSLHELMIPFYLTLTVIYITRQSHHNKFHDTATAYLAPIIIFFIYMYYTNSFDFSLVVLLSFLTYEFILLDPNKKMTKIWETLFIIIILMIASSVIGSSNGINIITGGLGSSEIEFELIDANTSVSNETLILVLYTNDIYYVVEKCIPAPQSPRLHIIPKEQVKSANIKRVTSRNTQFYEHWMERVKGTLNIANS